VKVNGLRADDLAGTGLVTRQRWAVPLWLGVLAAVAAFAWHRLVRLAGMAARCWRGSAPAAVLLAAYAWHGLVAALVVILAGIAAATIWRAADPVSFAWHVRQRAWGAVRWHGVYRRRWVPAMEGVGLSRVTRDKVLFVPRVQAVHSTRVVDVLDVRLLHGHTPEEVASAAEGLRHVYEAHRCKVTETRPGHVRVTFYARDPLTAIVPPIPPAPTSRLSGSAGADLHALPVGRSEDGTLYRLRQHGRHVLIAGASGAGKASVLWSQVAALAPLVRIGAVVLHGIDPKRMELVFAPELFTRLTTGTPADAADHLEDLVLVMVERQDRMCGKLREHTATSDDPAVVLIVDELASLTAYCTDRDAKKRIEAALSLLLSQGRAVGVYVVAALQDPRKDVVTFRDLFTTRIALRTTEAAHVNMILGDGALDRGAHCHRIPDTLPGVGYVLVEGAAEPVRVRFSYLTDGDIRALAVTCRPGAPDPHAPALPAVEAAVEPAADPAAEPAAARGLAPVVNLSTVELPRGVS